MNPRSMVLVALGGTFGVASREALGLALAPLNGASDGASLPWAVILANLAGAFLLGLLYGALAHRRLVHHTTRLGQTLRLLLGIGFCGGFTTYSTFAVGLVLMAGTVAPWVAVLWGLGIVTAGAVASWLGLAAGAGRASGSQMQTGSLP